MGIHWCKFEKQLNNQQIYAYISNIGIDPSDAKLLFKLLDEDDSGSLEFEELLSGMLRLRAGAKFMDVQKLAHATKVYHKRLFKFSVEMEKHLIAILSMLGPGTCREPSASKSPDLAIAKTESVCPVKEYSIGDKRNSSLFSDSFDFD